MIKVTQNPDEVLDMAKENIVRLKEQGQRVRGEEIIRAIRILQEGEESSKSSKQGRLYLELSIIKMCKIEYDTSKEVLLARLNRLEEAIKSGNIKVNSNKETNIDTSKGAVAPKKQPIKPSKPVVIDGSLDSSVTIEDAKRAWKDLLETLKGRRAMVVYLSLVPGKVIGCSNGVIEIEFSEQYSGNKIRLEQNATSKIINDTFSEILGKRVQVVYKVQNEDAAELDPEEALREIMGDALEVIDD